MSSLLMVKLLEIWTCYFLALGFTVKLVNPDVAVPELLAVVALVSSMLTFVAYCRAQLQDIVMFPLTGGKGQ